MTGAARREQLIETARGLFAERGLAAASVEEIAARAQVSKPVVYEHFGGKEGLYAEVVDREVLDLLGTVQGALTAQSPRARLEQATLAFLDYIERSSDGFRILVRDSPADTSTGPSPGPSIGPFPGPFVSMVGDVATRVEHLLAAELTARGYDAAAAPIYAQMLVGMVAATGQWWLHAGAPAKNEVAAHLVNLAWNGLAGMERQPALRLRA